MNCNVTALPDGLNEPIILMLVGGGNRFPAVVGAIRALEEIGLRVAKVIASSSAAIVAGMYVRGSTPEEMQEEALALDMTQFREISVKSMITGYGLCSGERLEEWVDRKLASCRFSDKMIIPLEIVATDMLSYRPVIFSSERSPDLKVSVAATASALVPGVFAYRKLTYGGRKYALIDGSLMAGVVEGRLDKSRKVLVVRLMSKRTLKREGDVRLSPLRYFQEMLTFSLHSQEKEFLKGGKWKDTICIYCSDISPSRFSLTAEEKRYLYQQGYEQTKKYLQYKWGV
jgi:NTE family protein